VSGLVLALRLARRELRGGLKGFGVFLACLTLGVAAIAAVQSVSRAVLDGLAEDGQAILGGDVAVRQLYQGFTADQLAAFHSLGRISLQAEMRAMARPGGDRPATLVELKAVDDVYPLFGRVELDGGGDLRKALERRDGRWGAVVEQGVLDRGGLKVGATIRVGDIDYQIRGLILGEPDRAAAGTISFAPRLMVALASMDEAGLLRPGALVYWNAKAALDRGQTPETWRAALAARFPDAGWKIYDRANASPRLTEFVERLTLFLTLVGLTALLVGGVGVGNAVRAHLDRRAGTVATLKCLGAPTGLVFSALLFQILALAGLGIVAGLAIGGFVPYAVAGLVGKLLPISLKIGVYPAALTEAAAFGLLTALTFSLWPLGRSLRISGAALFRDTVAPAAGRPSARVIAATAVSAAALAALAILTADNRMLGLWFVLAALVTFATFRGAAALVIRLSRRVRGRVSPSLRLAIANLHRPGNPTGAVVLSLGLGLTVLVTVAEIQGNFTTRINETLPRDAPSFFFIDLQPDQMATFATLATTTPGVGDLRSVPSLRGRIVSINGVDADKALVNRERAWILEGDRGLTYSAEVPPGSEIVAGAWWPTDYSGPPRLAIDTNVAEAFGIGVGDHIAINVLGRVIEAEVAVVRRVDFSRLQINFTLVFSPGVLEGAPRTYIATVRTVPEAEAGFQRAVLAEFPNVTAIRVKEAIDLVAGVIGRIGDAVRATAGITLVAGTLVLAGAMAAGHRRRVYDAVVFKVLGAARADVLKAFLYEYGLLGLVTAAVSALLGSLGAWAVLKWIMRWDWVFEPGVLIETLVVSTVVTLAFGFVGTWRALGQSAAPLLRNE
jgi:putative ABC transport system permease protein